MPVLVDHAWGSSTSVTAEAPARAARVILSADAPAGTSRASVPVSVNAETISAARGASDGATTTQHRSDAAGRCSARGSGRGDRQATNTE
ncbi:hypothetical protein ACTG9Q_31970 [Actinokineospora sp. 24-640]